MLARLIRPPGALRDEGLIKEPASNPVISRSPPIRERLSPVGTSRLAPQAQILAVFAVRKPKAAGDAVERTWSATPGLE
jgi:hypothetical protein